MCQFDVKNISVFHVQTVKTRKIISYFVTSSQPISNLAVPYSKNLKFDSRLKKDFLFMKCRVYQRFPVLRYLMQSFEPDLVENQK